MSLKSAMSALMIDAKLNKGKTKRLVLQGGLSVYLRINPDREITVALSRPRVYPSTTEFQTVLSQLAPQYFPVEFCTKPETASTGTAQYLVQRWTLPEQVQL